MDGLIYHVDVPTEDFQKATELYVSKRFVSMLEVGGTGQIPEGADPACPAGGECLHTAAPICTGIVNLPTHPPHRELYYCLGVKMKTCSLLVRRVEELLAVL